MNSRVCSKTQRLMFLLVSDGHICALTGTPTQRLQTKLYDFGSKLFSRISHMKYRSHLILGEVFAFFMLFHFLDSGLSVLNGFDFYCWWRDSENRIFTRASTKCMKRNGGALKKSNEYSESFNPTFSFLKSSFLLNLVSKKENWNSCFF